MKKAIYRNSFAAIGRIAAAFAVAAASLSAAPGFAQQSVHVETTVTDIVSSNFTYGPAGPNCDPSAGGTACKYLNFSFTGNCATNVETRQARRQLCTISGTPTILLSYSTPSGAHDGNGNPTGVCLPFFESLATDYEDGSTLHANGQGVVCCAAASCSGGFGPPFVTRESTIITSGTGRLEGVKGSGSETGAGYSDGSEFAQQEQIWVFPAGLQR